MNWPDSPTSGSSGGHEPSRIVTDEDYKARVRAEKQQGGDQEPPRDAPAAESPSASSTRATSQPTPDLPPASFSLLVEMLATQAMMALGLLAPPGSQQGEVQLPLARHLIDLLGMLEDKCRGNLNPQEQQMLDQVLHSLRMAFVEVRQQQ